MKSISSKVYGVDLDGVSVDFISSFSEHLKRFCGVAYDDSQITDYYWYKCIPGITEVMFWEAFHEYGRVEEGYQYLQPLPGAVEAIKFLIENAKDVWFVTGRPPYAFEQSVTSIQRLFGVGSDRLLVSGGKDYKSDVVNRLSIDTFIDDAPHYAESLANNTSAQVYLMDTTYNRGVEHPNITRVHSWAEFIEAETK